MRFTRTLALAAPFLVFAACGTSSGTNPTPATPAQLAAAAPTISTVNLADGPVDNTVALSDSSTGVLPPAPGAVDDCRTPFIQDLCNPHLFVRSEEVVERVNRHIYKFLVFFDDILNKEPSSSTDYSVTFKVKKLDAEGEFTIASTGTNSFAWNLGLAPLSNPAGTVQVATGTVTTNGSTPEAINGGTMELDLNALATVSPVAEVAGTLDVTFNLQGHREVTVSANHVQWDTDAPGTTPHSGYYVFYRKPGTGGSLEVLEDTLVPAICTPGQFQPMAAPDPSAPAISSVLAQVQLVSRWYVTTASSINPEPLTAAATSAVHGRTDAWFSGGQLGPSTALVALTCHQFDVVSEQQNVLAAWLGGIPEGQWLMQAETFSMLKAEDLTTSDGASKWVRLYGEPSACDPVLAPSTTTTLPSPYDNATDFPFSLYLPPAGSTPPNPYPFPGYP